MLKFKKIEENVLCSHYSNNKGLNEYYFTINSSYVNDLSVQLDEIQQKYTSACKELGLSADSLVFSRLYCSDMTNQEKGIRESKLFRTLAAASFSIIEQPPIFGGSFSLLVYHLKGDRSPFKGTPVDKQPDGGIGKSKLFEGHNYRMLWSTNYIADKPFDSNAQTHTIFDEITDVLAQQDMTYLDNAIRSWIYVRDVDNHYKGMVQARRELFTEHDLTEKTRYLASTGIEGHTGRPSSLVSVDMLSIAPLHEEQIIRMDALTHLPRTIEYGVTFERGLRVRFGDRSHLWLSGTASIDTVGDVVHISDPVKQTQRTMENVKALFEAQKSSLKDMAYLLVYLRDAKGAQDVLNEIQSIMPENMPIIFVKGPVCRPTWLVEVEGVGIMDDQSEYPIFE